jgi:hypothetical protein
MNRKIALKIKVKHLAQEARIIRKEEQRSRGDTRDWLYLHRINSVRPECRASHLAYAFSKGTPLAKVEKYPHEIPTSTWKRVTKMIVLYSGRSTEEYKNWITGVPSARFALLMGTDSALES